MALLDQLLGTLLTWPQDAIDIERLRGIEEAGASAYFGRFTQSCLSKFERSSKNILVFSGTIFSNLS